MSMFKNVMAVAATLGVALAATTVNAEPVGAVKVRPVRAATSLAQTDDNNKRCKGRDEQGRKRRCAAGAYWGGNGGTTWIVTAAGVTAGGIGGYYAFRKSSGG